MNQSQLPQKNIVYYCISGYFCFFASIQYLHFLIFLILTTTPQLPHPAHQSF